MNWLQYLTFVTAAFSGLCFGIVLMDIVAAKMEGLIDGPRFLTLQLVGVAPSLVFVFVWYFVLSSAGYH
jgi:hypothetical protein